MIICYLILSIGLLNSIFNSDDVNYYENRSAYKLPHFSLKSFSDKTFQDNLELSFADQIPMATTIKKSYNHVHYFTSDQISKVFLKNKCNNLYISINDSVSTFGCDRHIVYKQSNLLNDKEGYEKRIDNINKFIEKVDRDVYIYYIEKDTDINFVNNDKSNIYEYLKSKINSKKMNRFKINNFEEYKEYFYKTDHHWNYKGSYLAYTNLVSILTNDDPIAHGEEKCFNNKFSGSKASLGGVSSLYKEEFCAYTFLYPEFDITINGNKEDYGNEEYHLLNPDKYISYASFYGDDFAEIILDTNNSKKENILIIGESYDNAILKLLATHFNKTYSIDLRHYERYAGHKFNYEDYLLKNNINKILLIGNKDYFLMEDFCLEG